MYMLLLHASYLHVRSCVLVVDSPTATWRFTAMVSCPQQMLNNWSVSFVFVVDPSRELVGFGSQPGDSVVQPQMSLPLQKHGNVSRIAEINFACS
jgi:hypothetical protein